MKDGKIAEVSPSIDEARSSEVISAKDRIVTPGFIDIHVHCYDGYSAAVSMPYHYCLGRGVPQVLER